MKKLSELAKLIRYFILLSSTKAGSGHPTSSLSAADLMTVLMFGGFFKFDLKKPEFANNDRLIFSKGHASPLFYSLFAGAGAIKQKELETMRKFGSRLEGHPTMFFPFTESATGSLGQGLSIGVGMALNAKYVDKLPYKTFVLLGDSEMAEGSVWEAIQSAFHYKLDNLTAILDVNRLGQRGETMYGHDVKAYQKRVEAFGWETIVTDGHNLKEIDSAFKKILSSQAPQDDRGRAQSGGRPVMIIAKTIKGKGISLLEDQDNWHGKSLNEEQFHSAVKELGPVDLKLRGKVAKPDRLKIKDGRLKNSLIINQQSLINYHVGDPESTRKAYGNALVRIFPENPDMVVLDAEVSNSTYSEFFKKKYPEHFFEMFIAEQNMVGVALGLSRRGKIPFASTFAAFFARAFDQIRMSQYSNPNIKFAGSHAGVSIGEDGASQMALEDIAMFRSLLNGVVLYPSDAVSTEKLTRLAASHHGNVYIRTTRKETPVIYKNSESFKVGGCKIHQTRMDSGSRVVRNDKKGNTMHSPSVILNGLSEGSQYTVITIVGAGVTLHEALSAQEKLAKEGIETIVVDLYSIKPLDAKTLIKLAKKSTAVITVEDHFAEGGLGEAVQSALSETETKVYKLAVKKMPKSGKPDELLNYEEINSTAIIRKVKEVLKK